MSTTITYKERFVCFVCETKFETQLVLDNHQTINTASDPWKCIAQKKVQTAQDLFLKSFEEVDKSEICCSVCGKKIIGKNALDKHMKFYHKPKDKTCKICGWKLGKENSLNGHMKRIHSLIKCNLCRVICRGKHDLDKHWEQIHENKETLLHDTIDKKVKTQSKLHKERQGKHPSAAQSKSKKKNTKDSHDPKVKLDEQENISGIFKRLKHNSHSPDQSKGFDERTRTTIQFDIMEDGNKSDLLTRENMQSLEKEKRSTKIPKHLTKEENRELNLEIERLRILEQKRKETTDVKIEGSKTKKKTRYLKCNKCSSLFIKREDLVRHSKMFHLKIARKFKEKV